MQLLISHLCHELVSPVGAINNGVELLEDTGGAEADKEALDLIAQSGRTAAAKLRFYRVAYGSAGRATDFRIRDAAAVTRDLFAGDSRNTLDWTDLPAIELVSGAVQMLANLVQLATAFLPRGGTVSVRFEESAEALGVTVSAAGQGARIPELIRKIIEVGRVAVDHRTVHADYCHRLAVQLDVVIAAAESQDLAELRFRLPAAAEGA